MPLAAEQEVGRCGNAQKGEDPMSTSAYLRIPVVVLAALALAACPFKKEKKHDDPAIYYVSASGLDTNPGTQASPFKTITHAMRVATRSGMTVEVAPGLYNVANGEIFPITVPAGVLLKGDEANKGGGSTPTSIVGGGGQAPGATAGVGVALLPGTGSTIAGFTITNDNPALSGRYGIFLSNSSVTLRNNTVIGATHKAGVYIDASINHVITGNDIVNNGGSSAGSGLAFGKGGAGSKVENNVITGNGFGVEYDIAGGDLGGGSAGSAGGNEISCNTQNNLVSFAPSAITITAASNKWDHVPPTRGSSSGNDIFDSSGVATIDATPAVLTSNPCGGVTLYVDVSTGVDTNPGTQASPFKTITKAMTVATSGATVQVAPGIYDTSSLTTPEVFPITVPAGVLLIGNEGSKGSGTSIVGGGQVPTFPAGTSAAVHPGTGSTIAGFTITNDNPALSGRYGVFLSNSTVTLRNNTVTGATHVIGVYVADDGATPPTPSTNHVITGNRIVDNAPASGEGLAFVSGGAGSKVENNVITGNGFGVDYEVAGADLGGGSALSAGGNTISCNGFVDLFVGVPITVSAKNNLWDHVPPTPLTHACTFGGTGEDVCDGSAGGAATIDASNATLASPVCP
ncbi:MAG: DUF1565 domain-containing protein [Betaproteobacteria bacterium]|nr:MAG: DUF1565 domain-containing protein [Betaproteobacteria bacterium]